MSILTKESGNTSLEQFVTDARRTEREHVFATAEGAIRLYRVDRKLLSRQVENVVSVKDVEIVRLPVDARPPDTAPKMVLYDDCRDGTLSVSWIGGAPPCRIHRSLG